MSEAIERAARAIHNVDGYTPWDGLHETENTSYGTSKAVNIAKATACIEILSDLDEAAIEAGRRAVMLATNCHLHDECPDCPRREKESCREIVRAALRAYHMKLLGRP